MDELTLWLQRLGLAHYAGLFAAQEIGIELLPELSDADLRELGLPLGPRRIILREASNLASRAVSAVPSTRALLPGTAERRQLTLLFCDLVGSTALSNQLDPEDLRDVIGAYQQACALPIKLFEGHIARYVGDGILVYFGFPVAHEDDAERAVRAGLGIVEAVANLSKDLTRRTGLQLAVRIGVATGVVVVGDIVNEGTFEKDAVAGSAPNLAARLQGLAAPNTVVVSGLTKQLARSFSYLNVGEHKLKGIDTPVIAWQVDAETFSSRLEARSATSPIFVNRDQEILRLLEFWRRASAGNGQAVVISGEAGIGKSRLAVELCDRITAAERSRCACPPRMVRFQCSSHHANTSFYPIVRALEHLASLDRKETIESRFKKLTTFLRQATIEDEEAISLLADLCGLLHDQGSSSLVMTAREKRQRTIEAIKSLCSSLASERPLLILFEDCQWLDPTSHFLLEALVDWIRREPTLVIVTIRSDARAPGPNFGKRDLITPAPHVGYCELRQLDEAPARQLIAAVAGKPLPTKLEELVLLRSERIPLFAEELTIGLLESSSFSELEQEREDAMSLAIPSTINEALMARLDQTGRAREIAQQAAVIGREFSVALLSAMTGLHVDELLDRLKELEAASLICRSSVSPEIYYFRHALTRDVAYRSLLRRTRKELHLMLAAEFEVNGASYPEARDELIAQHYSAGGAKREAIDWWQRTARQAIARSAHEEAANMLRSAAREFKALDTPGSPDLELDLTLGLATALRALRGYAAHEVEEMLLRARELCAQVRDETNRFSVEWELFQCNLVKGDIDGAHKIAVDLFDHADRHPARPRVDAYIADGMVRFPCGDFLGACASFRQGLALCHPQTDEPHYFTHGQNPGLFCRSYLAHAYCFLGHLDQAREAIEQNLDIARARLGQPAHAYSYVNALTFAIRVYQFLGDVGEVRRLAEELTAICRRSRYEYYEALATAHLGWALGEEGVATSGIETMRQGLAALEKTGTVLALPGLYLLLSQLYLRVGLCDEANHTLQLAGRTRTWSAEIERIRGEILLSSGSSSDLVAAEAAYRSSLQLAREQKARSLELRAATSFARLMRRLGRSREGLDVLLPCIEGFTEGTSSKDVRDAKMVLRSLGFDDLA